MIGIDFMMPLRCSSSAGSLSVLTRTLKKYRTLEGVHIICAGILVGTRAALECAP